MPKHYDETGLTLSPSVEKMQLSYMKPRHREIARRLILGQTASEIARTLNMTAGRLSIIMSSPLFKYELNKLEQERDAATVNIAQQLRELAPDALDELARTMYTSKSEGRRTKCAESILDRAGHGAINKSAVAIGGSVSVHQNLTEIELKNLIRDRVEKMKTEIETRNKEIKEAETIVVDYDDLTEDKNGSDPSVKMVVL